VRTRSGLEARIAALAVVGALTIAPPAAPAQAVITEPIPASPAAGPPPTPSLPVASDTPPTAEVITDPIEPAADCSGWYLQSSYAGIWATGSTWWEYECSLAEVQYPACYYEPGPGMCEAGYTIWGSWTDRFYWDGSQPVFLGENSQFGCEHWWDAGTAQWWLVASSGCPSAASGNAAPTASFSSSCQALNCAFEASGSRDADGTLIGYSWDFGDGATGADATAVHSYAQAGSYTVTLTVTDDGGASASTSKTVTAENPPPPNIAPVASVQVGCTGLLCDLDGGASADADGTIVDYQWQLGDATTAAGRTARHSYAQAGTYTIKLTVTDDDGAGDTASRAIAPITGLTARGYKLKGLQKVDLSWRGATGDSFEIHRDGQNITTTLSDTYTDNLNSKGSGSYAYQVCRVGGAICSNETTVTF
jgi:PKD repeat protein